MGQMSLISNIADATTERRHADIFKLRRGRETQVRRSQSSNVIETIEGSASAVIGRREKRLHRE